VCPCFIGWHGSVMWQISVGVGLLWGSVPSLPLFGWGWVILIGGRWMVFWCCFSFRSCFSVGGILWFCHRLTWLLPVLIIFILYILHLPLRKRIFYGVLSLVLFCEWNAPYCLLNIIRDVRDLGSPNHLL